MSRVLSTAAAKVLIYLLSFLALFAFLFFFMTAQKYYAATAQPKAAQAESLPDEVVPKAGLQLGLYAEPLPVLQAAQAALMQVAAEVAFRQVEALPVPIIQPVIGLEVEAETLVAGSGVLAVDKQPNMAVLQAELERVAALGFAVDTGDLQYEGLFHNTAYCAEAYPHICGGNGVTASGTVPTPGLTAAADWSLLPPGTWLYIEGVGVRRVEDSGSAIKSHKLDINVATHDEALRWGGFGWHDVWVLQWPA